MTIILRNCSNSAVQMGQLLGIRQCLTLLFNLLRHRCTRICLWEMRLYRNFSNIQDRLRIQEDSGLRLHHRAPHNGRERSSTGSDLMEIY